MNLKSLSLLLFLLLLLFQPASAQPDQKEVIACIREKARHIKSEAIAQQVWLLCGFQLAAQKADANDPVLIEFELTLGCYFDRLPQIRHAVAGGIAYDLCTIEEASDQTLLKAAKNLSLKELKSLKDFAACSGEILAELSEAVPTEKWLARCTKSDQSGIRAFQKYILYDEPITHEEKKRIIEMKRRIFMREEILGILRKVIEET